MRGDSPRKEADMSGNVMKLVRIKPVAPKLDIKGLIKSIVGETEGPTANELAIAEEFKIIAHENNGDFDPEELSVTFGDDSVFTVYGSEDEDGNIHYQAVHQSFEPRCFTCGDLKMSFTKAVESLQSKLK